MEKELVIFHSFVTYSFSACARAHIRDQDWVDERHLMADHDPDQNHVGAEVDGKLASEEEPGGRTEAEGLPLPTWGMN